MTTVAKAKYKRILLKLSGEALAGDEVSGICTKTLIDIAGQIKRVQEMGVEVAVVIGGGNIFRGVAASTKGMDRTSADHMGMLATCINGLALQDALEKQGCFTRVMSALEIHKVCEPYIRRRAVRHLEKGRIVIFVAGTGNPYFTTDTAASLRGMEVGAEILLKATKVDGVYDSDPVTNPDARMFRQVGFMEVINRELKVMDTSAISLCRDNNLPIIVFNLLKEDNIQRVVSGEPIGTLVTSRPVR